MTKLPIVQHIQQHSAYSRRKVLEFMEKGMVKCNGLKIYDLKYLIDPNQDSVWLGGQKILPQKRLLYIALNKPAGIITTMDDPKNRPSIKHLISSISNTLVPVGRLDKDTEGLIIITNDGHFAHQLMHPSFELKKRYAVTLDKAVNKAVLEQLAAGFFLEDGPIQCFDIQQHKARELDISISEGRNRIVRRLFEFLGFKVIALRRLAIGPVQLGKLAPGDWRELSDQELAALATQNQES